MIVEMRSVGARGRGHLVGSMDSRVLFESQHSPIDIHLSNADGLIREG